MQPVQAALEQIGAKYRAILSENMDQASAKQMQLVRQLKDLDKHAAAGALQLKAAQTHANTCKVAESLRAAIFESRKSLQSVVDSLYNIDTQLPESDRLLARGQTNKAQYPGIYALLGERAVLYPQIGQNQNTAVAAQVEATTMQISPKKSAREALRAVGM